MNFTQNINVNQRNAFNAGGIVHVPPTGCLPPACASARVPAYVECTGKAVTKKMNDLGAVRPMAVNRQILFSELRL